MLIFPQTKIGNRLTLSSFHRRAGNAEGAPRLILSKCGHGIELRHDQGVDTYDDDPSNQLVARFQADSDGTGKLLIRASSGGFSGESGAWFDTQHLAAFASALESYPLPEDDPPHIESGFWKRGTQELEQELLNIIVRPAGNKGQVSVRVHLATEVWPDMRPDSYSDVRLELLTTYERLRQFSGHLTRVIRGELDSATLGGEKLI
jgi:hypothetical protein